MVAIVTSIGSISASFVIKTLKEMKFRVIGVDLYPKSWVASSSEVDVFLQTVQTSDENTYLNQILEICNEYGVNLILPLTDVDVDFYSKYYELFSSRNIVITISNTETITLVRNKLEIHKKLVNNNIQTIPTYNKDDYLKLCKKTPVIAKRMTGRSSQGLFFINDLEEVKVRQFSDDYVFQPFIEGDIIVVDLLCNLDRSKIIYIARHELTRTSNGAGIAVMIIDETKIKKEIMKLCKSLNIKGYVNIEFIKHENDYYLMDFNPRPSAGVVFSNYAGYNFIKNHINIFLNLPIEDCDNIKHGLVITRRYMEVLI